jgi:hypothetical protein
LLESARPQAKQGEIEAAAATTTGACVAIPRLLRRLPFLLSLSLSLSLSLCPAALIAAVLTTCCSCLTELPVLIKKIFYSAVKKSMF